MQALENRLQALETQYNKDIADIKTNLTDTYTFVSFNTGPKVELQRRLISRKIEMILCFIIGKNYRLEHFNLAGVR